jgi:2-polyprenyl-6-methoxyphenol hydroxylase-like FAD-dependent oxidoreductase
MRVLISGAGIAGPTLAYWLAHHGMTPTLVEKAPKLRTGFPADAFARAVRSGFTSLPRGDLAASIYAALDGPTRTPSHGISSSLDRSCP